MGVKLFAWLGGVAMFFGVVFFVKYAFEKNLIPPAVRIAMGFVTGTGMLVGGLWAHRLPRYRVLAPDAYGAGKSPEWPAGRPLALADEVAPLDHPIIERIQAAGGIIHARTTTPEFCCAPYCHSRAWGITRNPWNPARTPGGSTRCWASSISSRARSSEFSPLRPPCSCRPRCLPASGA